MDTKPIELSVLGQKVRVRPRGDLSVAQDVLALAEAKLREVEATAAPTGIAPHAVACLALLSLAEDFEQLRRKTEHDKGRLNERFSKLERLLELEFPDESKSPSES